MMYRSVSRGALAVGLLLGAPTLAVAATPETPVVAVPADPVAGTDADPAETGQIVVTGRRSTRSVTQLDGVEMQKILPGINPLKAIQTLPGVTFLTADPWGNNEQNISLFIHGFNQQQLGYTLDGIPLGDQNYGNYNGLSPQRAIISENVGRVTLASGAGDLGTASTSNLGGTIDTFSSDPKPVRGATIAQTVGSYDSYRTFVRVDSGDLGGGNAFYVSGVRQDARAWDFNGKQGGYQANGKFVHDGGSVKLTGYFAYSDKTEPNEDATVVNISKGETPGSVPYTRPFLYPNFKSAVAYLTSPQYTAAKDNYRNYYSDAQRTDYLGYLAMTARLSDAVTYDAKLYYHHNDGVGVVAGPITVAGLPQLFSVYYPGRNLASVFGGSGFATRTTEYRIDRGGIVQTMKLSLGNHDIEFGGWFEHQSSSAFRRWYALDVNNPSTPYQRPRDTLTPLITQYYSEVRVDELQSHIQDAWHVLPTVTVLAGFKSTYQFATQRVKVQPLPGSFAGSIALPNGALETTKVFLPQVGAVWDVTPGDQLFANAQKNIRQFQTSAAAGLSPFALGSQGAFDLFSATVQPETSWTYEGGLRSHHRLGGIFSIEGQLSVYHVDFSNRLLGISPNPIVNAITSGAAILQNVGGVKTNGVDFAFTLHAGPRVSLYNALSYNTSKYKADYVSGTATVPTRDKNVPGSPDWLNKTVLSVGRGIFDAQLIGDYIGRRYATYTNDLSVAGYFTLAGQVGATIPLDQRMLAKALHVSVNVTNITDRKAASSLSIGSATNTYSVFPLAPRQVFGTVSVSF
ncbi:TonB-dependent receptor [Sphingomonas sp. TREG-RG-20F-R18-01]|uniref:TonB-dependent receptor n=1 Tax=Sphingomonas sp. TREG-RG-20F-R18-01 TaxID=2914982 RepID=UPI001F5AAFC8|nr:TonB-dependent receptor [Sphingomonas sp. TREG-RG-20F-R18-01]